MRKQDFMRLAESAGITVTYREGRRRHPRTGEPVPYSIDLDAPDGKAFVSSGCSVDCSMQGEPGRWSGPDWGALVAELRTIIAEGFEDAEGDE